MKVDDPAPAIVSAAPSITGPSLPASSGVVPGDVPGAATDLLTGLVDRPWGQVSPSVYETGRLVSLTPWLSGHERRITYLLAGQRPDGAWGAPDDGYALVPTLSATEALLATVENAAVTPGNVPLQDVTRAAERGVRVLLRWADTMTAAGLPDMPAIELIVPRLVGQANARLERLEARQGLDACENPENPEDLTGQGTAARPVELDPSLRGMRLRCPAGMDEGRPEQIAAALRAGVPVPQKLMHALEIAGPAAQGLPSARPEPTGTIGASPAATAAWLGEPAPGPHDPARLHLEAVEAAHGGPVPCGIPITVFERAWVLSTLIRAGLRVPVPPALLDDLQGALGPEGTPAAAGLPADADTTGGTLYALALAGRPCAPDPLWTYDTGSHFCTWPGEDGFSVTTNAHVLEAFGEYLVAYTRLHGTAPPLAVRYRETVRKITTLLCERQRPDGSWHDRWHASPYYATACCAIALGSFGGPAASTAISRTADWVLGTQRPDGSWGVWGGTVEETCYALQILLLSGYGKAETGGEAVRRGYAFITSTSNKTPHEALWHDKDLYYPQAIVRAGLLATVYLAQQHGVAGRHEFRKYLTYDI